MKTGQFITNNKKRLGFTLIELLVVIAIIALLISIVLPTLKKVTSYARQTVCVSNLRQLGMMISIYSEENNQAVLPSARNSAPELRYPDNQDLALGGPPWYEILRETQGLEYSKGNASILHCPLDRRDKGYCSYSSNRYIMGFTTPRTTAEAKFPVRKMTSIKGSPGSLILLGERGCVEEGDVGKVDGQWSMSGISVSEFLGSEGSTGSSSMLGFYSGRHSIHRFNSGDGGSRQYATDLKLPFLLLDGHAEVYKGEMDCMSNEINTNDNWEYDNIYVLQSPGGYWPKLKSKNGNGAIN